MQLLGYIIGGLCLAKFLSRGFYSLDSEVAVYGAFHIARICGNLLTGDKWGGANREEITRLINQISTEEFGANQDADSRMMTRVYIDAHTRLKHIRNENISKYPNPTLYFKAGDVQKSIEKALLTKDE